MIESADAGGRGVGSRRLPAGPGRRSRGDAGMVLLEAALAIPMLLLVAIACLGAARVAVDELAAVAAAREAALLAARGTAAEELAANWPDAEIRVQRRQGTVTVTVRSQTAVIPGLAGAGIDHLAVAVAAVEPGR